MAGENPGGSTEIAVVAVDSTRTEAANNMVNENALLLLMKEKKRIDPFDGGSFIGEPIRYGDGLRAQTYAGAQVLKTQQPRMLTQAKYYKTNYVVPVVITGDELADTVNQKGRVKLLMERTRGAHDILSNTINEDFYSDVPTNGGLNIQGLQAALPSDPTTGAFGSISRADNPWWRHHVASAAYTEEDILPALRNLIIIAGGKSMGSKLDIGVADMIMYGKIAAAVDKNTRYSPMAGQRQKKFQEVGITHIMFENMAITADAAFGAGAPAQTLFGLNTKFVKYRPHRRWNRRAMKQNRPFDQDIEGSMLYHRAALTFLAMRNHFRMTDTTGG